MPVGVHFYELMVPEIRNGLGRKSSAAFRSRNPIRALINNALTKDGRTVVLETNGVPMEDGNGRLVGYRGANADITARMQVEKELRQERDRAQKYLDLAGFIFLALDCEGKVTTLNKKGYQIVGCSSSLMGKELVRFPSRAVTPADERGVQSIENGGG